MLLFAAKLLACLRVSRGDDVSIHLVSHALPLPTLSSVSVYRLLPMRFFLFFLADSGGKP